MTNRVKELISTKNRHWYIYQHLTKIARETLNEHREKHTGTPFENLADALASIRAKGGRNEGHSVISILQSVTVSDTDEETQTPESAEQAEDEDVVDDAAIEDGMEVEKEGEEEADDDDNVVIYKWLRSINDHDVQSYGSDGEISETYDVKNPDVEDKEQTVNESNDDCEADCDDDEDEEAMRLQHERYITQRNQATTRSGRLLI